MRSVPALRIIPLNADEPRSGGRFVLLWMIAQRRTRSNFALQRAVEWGRRLGKPVLVFEALRCDHRWASHRLHAFIIQGMADNAAACREAGVRYYPYVEPAAGAGKGLLAALASEACVVVTDDYPTHMLRHMAGAGAVQAGVRLEAIDGNGLLPLRATDKAWPSAYSFRRMLQRELPVHLEELPEAEPLAAAAELGQAVVPHEVLERWAPATRELLELRAGTLDALPIDASVAPVETRGGAEAGGAALRRFVDWRLERYATARNEPQEDVPSGLSPYLHFGHVSVFEILDAVAAREGWRPEMIAVRGSGQREGWWRMSEPAESFMDELVTWREVGFNFCHLRADYDRWESLPDWARATLDEHADDEREQTYTLEEFERARTHDPLWNAAQRQLRHEGCIHNYLRMLWGKKILQWTASPREALAVMVELNNKYAIDGRDPNSYTGIMWVLGRYDRPWGPERPIFGKIRYMTSENTARKVKVKDYIRHYTSLGE
jgi:deoxyribodipyrimidine photo-lyase